MKGLDTNVLIRYLVRDDPGQTAMADRFIETECTLETPGFVSLKKLGTTNCFDCLAVTGSEVLLIWAEDRRDGVSLVVTDELLYKNQSVLYKW